MTLRLASSNPNPPAPSAAQDTVRRVRFAAYGARRFARDAADPDKAAALISVGAKLEAAADLLERWEREREQRS